MVELYFEIGSTINELIENYNLDEEIERLRAEFKLSDTEIALIDKDKIVSTLAEDTQIGSLYDKKYSGDEGIEFHQGKIYFSEKFLLLSPQKTTEPTRIARAKSVLICVRAPVGTVNINPRQICIGRGLASATPLAEISADFLFYLLNARKSALIEQATGSTFISVTGEQIKELLIPLPPLAEQEKIVSSITQYETILKSIQE